MKKISISIVTYNSADEIGDVLDSIQSSSIKDQIKTYVIDNNSSDDTVQIVCENYPDVILIKNKNNLGFGRAHNLVIHQVQSEYHIIINPDIQFDKTAIEKLVEQMDTHNDYAIASPCIIFENGEIQYLPKRKPKLKYVMSGMFENKIHYFKKIRAEYTMKDTNFIKNTPIDFCTGCFMFIRTKILKEVMGFDENYFLHFEDVDLTLRLQKLGKTMYVPSIKVFHKWHRDNINNFKVQRIALVSMIKFFFKWGLR